MTDCFGQPFGSIPIIELWCGKHAARMRYDANVTSPTASWVCDACNREANELSDLRTRLAEDAKQRIADALDAARAEERRACAEIALIYRDKANAGEHPDSGDPTHSLGQGYAANRIAKAILAREKEAKGGVPTST